MSLTLLGTEDSDEYDALAQVIQDWSDGASLKWDATFDGLYWAEMGTDTRLEVAFGSEATLTSAPNGAYSMGFTWTYGTTTADYVDSTTPLMSFYLTTAAVTADTDLGNDNSAAVGIYYDNLTAELKYDWNEFPNTMTSTSTDDFTTGGYIYGTFYMPAESDADGETTATGDRINKGDKVSMFAGSAGAPDTECNADVTMTLGAATLAAGSFALAAALSI